MKDKYNKFFCYILMVLMLFSGMCLENIKADSFFERTLVDSTFSCIDSVDLEKEFDEPCTVEVLQKKGQSSVKNRTKYIADRKGIKNTVFLLTAQFTVHSFTNGYDIVQGLQLPEACGNAVVLHYIHNQDGEK